MTEREAQEVEIALGCVHWALYAKRGCWPWKTACEQEIALHRDEGMVGATGRIEDVNCLNCSEAYTRLYRAGHICTHHGAAKLKTVCRRCPLTRRRRAIPQTERSV